MVVFGVRRRPFESPSFSFHDCLKARADLSLSLSTTLFPFRYTYMVLFFFRLQSQMGAYKYVEELYKKKQSDVLRFLLRVRLVFPTCITHNVSPLHPTIFVRCCWFRQRLQSAR